jgi:spore germination cell wall hydrolase CwlJ-like protein
MERIHIFIGIIIFLIIAGSAAADEALTRDERIVALTLLGEARGEKTKGMYAVGCVIEKRASERNLTPAQVCLQPYQFSIWNAGKGKVKKESELYHLWKSDSKIYARLLAKRICSGYNPLKQSFTNNANHYYSSDIKVPYWAKGKKPTRIIGKHLFFKLP